MKVALDDVIKLARQYVENGMKYYEALAKAKLVCRLRRPIKSSRS